MTLTPDTILAGTRVLAPFEEYEIKEIDGVWKVKHPVMRNMDESEMWFNIDTLAYHTDYDSLHDAWEVFRDLDQNQFTEAQKCDFLQHRERIVRAFGYDSIEKCFSLLVDAVSWYVAQKGGSHAV